MRPKKTQVMEQLDEIKKALDFLSELVSAVRIQQKTILNLVEELKSLKLKMAEKRQADHLENQVSDLEQYTRKNNVIITSLQVKPHSYARAVTAEVDGTTDDKLSDSVKQKVASFLQSRGIEMDQNTVEACHPLPRRSNNDKPAIIMMFVNRIHKVELLKQGRKLKGSDVYINERLTQRKVDIARKARFLKKQGKIQATWTSSCKIFIKLNGAPEEAKVLVIRDIEELERFN